MANRTWTAGPSDAGLRRAKFLADPTRLGSRGKAAAALQRGKIFINDRETTLAEAGIRLAPGDTVRLWFDRPGSGRRPISIGDARDLPIVYEDDALIVLNKPEG